MLLSRSSIFDSALKGSGFERMKPLIFAQAQLESANFQSNLFKIQKNAFGMKNAFQRKQLGSEVSGNSFRGYNSLTQSIQDQILWFNFTVFPVVTDASSFVRQLKKRNYFEESESFYLNALNSWL